MATLAAIALAAADAHAFHHPRMGRFCQRDPSGYADGMNRYQYVNSNPTRYVDPQGTWKRVGKAGHVWEAEKNDNLWKLAAKPEYGGKGQNWPCLWPTKDTKNQGYPDTIHPCDRYDASNLATPSPGATAYRVIVAHDFLEGYRSVFGTSIPYLRADKVAPKIKDVSGQGGTPISYLLVAGHSGRVGISGWKYNKTTKAKDDKNGYDFTVKKLIVLDEATTFERAQNKRGPVRCWFTRDAAAVFAGCGSSAMAEAFAEQILRRGAVAFGTNQLTGWSGGHMYWNYRKNAKGKDRPQSHGDWHTAPVWVKHEGAN